MPDPVPQQVPTALGTLVLALPAGAALTYDPVVVDGDGWCWSPRAGSAVFTVSSGDAGTRTPEFLLTLERGLANSDVVVLRDEPGTGDGEHRLDYLATRTPARTFAVDAGGGHSHPAPDPGGMATHRARYRFWRRGGSALRVGYRLDESVAGELRATLDEILDSARLR